LRSFAALRMTATKRMAESEKRKSSASVRVAGPFYGRVVPAAIIALVSLVVFFPTFKVYFLADDFAFVHAFHHLTAADFLRLLHSDMAQFVWGDSRQEFRPLYSLYYVIAYHIWGLHPWGYHLCGWLLHVGVAYLVFLIARTVAPEDPWFAGAAGLLFAVQPPHAQALSLIVGLMAESFPAFLYLACLLAFIRYRSSGRTRDLVISTLAFFGCLLSKESAVTLPVMLVGYDCLRALAGREGDLPRQDSSARRSWWGLLAPYSVFGVLLAAYLEWRHLAFASFIREAGWASHAKEAVTSTAGFWLHFRHVVARIWKLQVFNFQNLFPYPPVVQVLVLILFGLWIYQLWRRSASRQTVLMVLYFGLVWYLITNLPYLIEGYVTYHLYLPLAGASIATAALASVTWRAPGELRRSLGLGGLGLLITISAVRGWTENREYARFGDMSASMSRALAKSLVEIPKGSFVVVWPGESKLVSSGWGEQILPFAVQPPFAPTDLYSDLRIVEHPDLSCCGVPEWWEKTRPVLTDELDRSPGEDLDAYLFAWDGGDSSFRRTRCVLHKEQVRARVTRILHHPPEDVGSVTDEAAKRLVGEIGACIVDAAVTTDSHSR